MMMTTHNIRIMVSQMLSLYREINAQSASLRSLGSNRENIAAALIGIVQAQCSQAASDVVVRFCSHKALAML